MPVYEITGKDGKLYEVEGETPDGALAALQEHLGDDTAVAETRSMGDEIKRQLGLTARMVGEGLAGTAGVLYDPIAYVQNKTLGTNVPPLGQQVSNLMTEAGVPTPETGAERVAQVMGQAMTGGGAMVKGGQIAANVGNTLARTVAKQSAMAPGSQITSAGASGAGQQLIAEAGGGPVAQFVAGAVSGTLPNSMANQGRRIAQHDFRGRPYPAERIEPTLEPLPSKELTGFAKSAAEGNSRAQRILAEESLPDAETVAAAKRLGIYEYLQPDQVTTNQAYREFAQAVKSVPGSSARAKELENFDQLFKRANDLVEEIGGTNDMSALDKGVRNRMFGMQRELDTRADGLYARVRAEVDPSTTGPASETLGYLRRQIDELGGIKNLSAEERRIYNRLMPKKIINDDGIEETILPTYANIDRLRHELTSARSKKQGPFKDMDGYSAGQLESALRKDQVAFLEGNPKALNMFEDAQTTVRVRKGLENDIEGLFGKGLDGSMLQGLRTGTTKLSAGDVSQFRRIVGQIPEDMRSEVVASSLQAAFRRNAKDGNMNFSTYSKWYEGLRNNKEAYKAFMEHLPPGADKMLNDLYRVSSGVAKASRERITTGRIQAVMEDIKGADTLLRRVYDVTKRSAPAVILEPAATSIGLPGAGVTAVVASALTKGKPDVLKKADDLIASPQFGKLIESVNTDGVDSASAAVLRSPAFKRWANAAGIEKPQEWMQGVIQAARMSAQNEEDE